MNLEFIIQSEVNQKEENKYCLSMHICWRGKWQPTPIFLPGESMDRGAWQSTAHGVTRVGHDLLTKPPCIYVQSKNDTDEQICRESWLKTQHSENKDHGIGLIISRQIDGK